MDYMQIAGSGIVWFMCGLVIFGVIIQTIIFMKKGWDEATKLGVKREALTGTVKASISLSILPTVPILISLFLLLPLLGIPLPWLRLSVIGSGTFEMIAATMGIEAVGEVFGGAISAKAFISAMWVMTIGGTSATFITLVILKPICNTYDKFANKNMAYVNVIGACSIAGVIGSLFVQYCTKDQTTLIVGASAFAFAFMLKVLAKKNDTFKKIADYNLAISLIVGMIVAGFIG